MVSPKSRKRWMLVGTTRTPARAMLDASRARGILASGLLAGPQTDSWELKAKQYQNSDPWRADRVTRELAGSAHRGARSAMPPTPRTTSPFRQAGLLLSVWMFALGIGGCGTDSRAPLLGGDYRVSLPASDGGFTRIGTSVNACSSEGTTQPCHRTISQHAGVVTCFDGTQTCHDGQWSDCGGPAQSISAHKSGTSVSPALRPPVSGGVGP